MFKGIIIALIIIGLLLVTGGYFFYSWFTPIEERPGQIDDMYDADRLDEGAFEGTEIETIPSAEHPVAATNDLDSATDGATSFRP